MGSWVVKVTPRPFYPRERKLIPILNRLSGPQNLLAWVRKISFLGRFDARTTQSLTRRYMDYCIAAHLHGMDRENVTFMVQVLIESMCARLRNCVRN
jgi:hypothetical protein